MGILYMLEGIRNPVMSAILATLTYFGSELLLIAAAFIVYWCVDKKHGYYLMAVGLFGTVVNQFLKIVCQVPRPWVRDPNFTIVESARAEATGYSFPSGHTQNAAGIYGGIARFTKKTSVRVVCLVLVVLVALSRMYLGVHYPTDVLFGLVCGAVFVFALYPVFEKSDEKPQVLPIVFGAGALVSLAAALYTQLRVWPADIDAANLVSAINSQYMMFGCMLAAAIGAPIERKRIGFETKAPWWAQILKVLLGLVCVLGLRAGLKPLVNAVFGPAGVSYAIRYGLMVLFALLVWPLTFGWFSRGCRRKKTEKTE